MQNHLCTTCAGNHAAEYCPATCKQTPLATITNEEIHAMASMVAPNHYAQFTDDARLAAAAIYCMLDEGGPNAIEGIGTCTQSLALAINAIARAALNAGKQPDSGPATNKSALLAQKLAMASAIKHLGAAITTLQSELRHIS